MNIDEMTDEEKSVMLAKVVGWYVVKSVDNDEPVWCLSDGREEFGFIMPFRYYPKASGDDLFRQCLPDLYNPVNMALAWMVLNWASENLHGDDWHTPIGEWVWGIFPTLAWLRPVDAQRAWLDKVLELAVELGKVEAA